MMTEDVPQECATHVLWRKQLIAGNLIALAASLYLTLFTDNMWGAIAALSLAVILYIVTVHIDTKHFMWHIDNEIKKHKGEDVDE